MNVGMLVKRAVLNPFESPRKRFGEMMVASNYLSREELDELLDAQRAAPSTRLGSLCLQRGYATASQVMDVLARQLPVVRRFTAP
jgi:hypothetical protein